MNSGPRFQAAIFDLDGTLLDTLRDIGEAMNAVLVRYGHPTHPIEAYRELTGDGVTALLESSFPPGQAGPDVLKDALALLRVEYARTWRNYTRPFPGIPELLDALTTRGIRLNILSNKMDEFTRLAADVLLGRWRFDQVIGVRPDLPRKPDPAGARLIARSSGLPVEAFLYLGDTKTDMQTASAAGMFAVGAAWGFRTEKELWDHGARAVVRRPEEVIPFFDNDHRP